MLNKFLRIAKSAQTPASEQDKGNGPIPSVLYRNGGRKKGSLPTIIGASVEVVGNVKSGGEFQVDGSVEGQIIAKRLIISETGIVSGEIIADVLEVWGCISGRIKAKSVYFRDGSEILADVLHSEIEISKESRFEGSLSLMQEARDKRKLRAPRTYDAVSQQNELDKPDAS